MKQSYCILFAGPPGSSKTPIAYYLSGKLGLPIYNNDAVRTEILEDTGTIEMKEYLKRRDKRIKDIVQRRISFILDASIDREWKNLQPLLHQYEYHCFIISLDVSPQMLAKLYKLKGYSGSLQALDKYVADHRLFVRQHKHLISFRVTDKNFRNRLKASHGSILKWLKTQV